jgi:chromate reductase
MRILGIAGSLRRGSHNRRLLRAAGAQLPPGADFVEWDRLAVIPAFNEDEELDPPEAVSDFLAEIESADALLIATPEYNASVPGALKNALDWVSRPLAESPMRNKPAAVIGASTGMFGAVWAQAETRKVLGALGARVVDREVPVPTADEIVRDREKLESSGTHGLIVGLLAELLELVRERRETAAAAAAA